MGHANQLSIMMWSDKMKLGIAEIDEQHKMLVGILNRLYQAVVAREGEQITAEILDTLIDYTQTHFSLEERLLREAGYDPHELISHMQEHQNFVQQLATMAARRLTDGKSISFELIQMLQRWLVEHIQISDRRYAEVLAYAEFNAADWSVQAKAVMGAKYRSRASRPWWRFW